MTLDEDEAANTASSKMLYLAWFFCSFF